MKMDSWASPNKILRFKAEWILFNEGMSFLKQNLSEPTSSNFFILKHQWGTGILLTLSKL